MTKRLSAWAILLGLITAIPAGADGIDEIVVTARKREESLQDVPLSVSALSTRQIQERGILDNYQLADFTVNFNTMQQLGRRDDRPVIRGMSAPGTRGESNASYFVDGVYVSGSISTAVLDAVERVEILRGPQSAQFGRATFSGAVNYVTKRPSNDFELELNTRAGTHDDYKLSTWISGPVIADRLLFFTSGSWQHFGGEWKNSLPAGAARGGSFINPPQQADYSRLGGTETTEWVGKLLFLPTENAEISVKYSVSRGDDDHHAAFILKDLNCFLPTDPSQPWFATSGGAYCGEVDIEGLETRVNLPDFRSGIFASAAGSPDNPDLNWVAAPADPGTRRRSQRVLLEYLQNIGDWNLTARASYNEERLSQVMDLDRQEGRPLFGLFHFHLRDHNRDYAYELRVSSPPDRRVRGTIGGYFYDFRNRDINSSFTGFGMAQKSDPQVNTTENRAIFGNLDIDLSDHWTLSLEGRYAEDDKAISSGNGVAAENTFQSFTPRVTLRFQPDDDRMFYLLMAKGNKPGGFNDEYFTDDTPADISRAALADGRALVEEETAWTYEAGTKLSWLGRRLRTNVALFYIDWTNQSLFETVTIQREVPVLTTAITNAGKSRSIGLEMETQLSLTDNLLLIANYGYTDAEFVRYNDEFYAATTGIDDPDFENGGNTKGFRLPNVPEHSGVLGVVARNDLRPGLEGFIRADFLYESDRMGDADNLAQIGARKTMNLRLGVEAERWTATAYVTNLMDDQTPTSIAEFIDFLEPPLVNGQNANIWTLNPNRGRNWGLELQYRY